MLNQGIASSTAITILVVGLLAYQPMPAQRLPLPMFEDATIDNRFSPDPTTFRGISGGSLPGRNIAGRAETTTGPCVGFVDEKPDHVIVLKDFFNYLKLQVQSPRDTTLIVRGPGGSWCNDDFEGKNPGMAGQWLAGKYSIWVGSYDQTKYYPYMLQITQNRQ